VERVGKAELQTCTRDESCQSNFWHEINNSMWKNESVERLGLSKRAAGRCLAKTQSSVIPCAGTNTDVYLPSKDTKLGRL
jgi:hypothetical protein